MDAKHKHSKQTLDAAIEMMRAAKPDRDQIETGAARVWAGIAEFQEGRGIEGQHLSSGLKHIESCQDYRALIPEYLGGRLSPARALLLTDHTHECVACRNALNQARGAGRRTSPAAVRRGGWRPVALTAAAALIVAVVLGQSGYLNFLLPVHEVHAMARSIDGQLYKVAGLNMNAVTAGEVLKSGEPVRTGANSRAVVELADGTRIEMRERSQLSLSGARDGIRVDVDRGSVIVEAAKQRGGHLYVATEDCTVSVVGTVFAVSAGVKGARVSVLEGEVRVAARESVEQTLLPGQQMTTTPSLERVPIQDEIAWSRNLDTHLALLRAVADVNAFLRDRVPGPRLRFTSALAPLVPADTVIYGAFPNVSAVLGQAYDLFRQRIDQSPLLKTWWSERSNTALEEMIQHVRALGSYLGDEIAIAVTGNRSGPSDVIVLAQVLNAGGALTEINALAAGASGGPQIRVLTDPAQLAAFTSNVKGPIAYAGERMLVLASSPRAIYNVIVAQQTGASGFTSQPFYSSIAESYSKGAGTLFAADLATLFSDAQRSAEARAIGLTSLDRLVLEQKQTAGKTMTRAAVNFSGERVGVAAWLASPAPMGALEFVSPQAYGLGSVVTKDARTILNEILSFGGNFQKGAGELEKFERDTGIDVHRDLAEPLGGEFLFAMDGPFLPMPSWKIVAEVYDSARLQNTIERLVSQTNSRFAPNGGDRFVTLSSEAVGGQIYYKLSAASGLGTEIHYTYALGYIIAAPSRALVSQALQYQQSRSSIVNSAKFRSMMPADGTDHCSAILYQNLTETAASIAGYVPSGIGGVTSQQLQTLRQTVELTPATLVCVAGEPNRIVMGYQGDLAFNVLMLGGLREMMQTLERRN
jgi:hypothetical protein